MISPYEKIQILYEISLTIGEGNSIQESAKKALSIYLRKLNCTAGVIFAKSEIANIVSYKHIYSIPRRIETKSLYEDILSDIPKETPHLQSFLLKLPIINSSINNTHSYLMELPDYGLILLIKKGEPFSADIIHSLKPLNKKLAETGLKYQQISALEESNKRYQLLSESTFESIFLSEKGVCTNQNSIAENLFGYSLQDAIGRPGTDWIHPDYRKIVIENMMAGNQEAYEVVAQKKDGSTFPCEIQGKMTVFEGKAIRVTALRDITSRKKAIEAQKASEQRFTETGDLLPQPIWEVNIDGKFTYTNKAGYEKMGYSKDDIEKGVLFTDLIVDGNKTRIKENFMRKIRGLINNDNGFICKQKDGSTFPALIYTAPIRKNGKIVGIRGITLDITRQKESKKKLQQNLLQQETLSDIAINLNSLENFNSRINSSISKIGNHLNVSRICIFENNSITKTTTCTFEWCNIGIESKPKTLHNIEYKNILLWQETLQKKGKIFIDDTSKISSEIYNPFYSKPAKSIVAYPIFVKGNFFGFIVFNEYNINRKWEKSEIEALRTFSGMIANIYERKLTEQSLKESESKNRAILESIPDILFQFDKKGKIISYRNSSTEPLVIAPSNFLGKNIKEVFPASFSDKAINAIQQCITHGQFKYEYVLTINNQEKYYEARLARMNQNEVIAIIRDVSERIKFEEQLTQERDKANRANKAKSQFLASMSHEIRTPMNAILGFSEALYHKLESKSHQEMIKSVLNSGNLLLSLLNDILDLSKIEAGKLEILNHPLDLKNILHEIQLLFTDKAKQKGVEISVSYASTFPNTIILDEIRIKQIIFNIVGNAVKFTSHGFVSIYADFVFSSKNKGELIISVEDSGIGIPKSDLEHIFEIFTQQQGQINRKFGGTGIGLTISKRLVEKMKGVISVTSEIGKGSVFKVKIPDVGINTMKIERKGVSDKSQNIVFEKGNLLIVDDISTNIQTVSNFLDPSNITISSAETGEIALEILKHTNPDLILLDIRMPGIDGYEVARRIKADTQKAHIPIIAFTASVFSSDKIDSSGDFDGFLQKPVNRDELFTELARFLKHKIKKEILPKKQVVTDSSNNSIHDIIFVSPNIIKTLNKVFIPQWEDIKDQFVLYEIESFNKKLYEFATNNNLLFLKEYTIEISQYLEQLDLTLLQTRLADFSSIIKKLIAK